MTPNEIIKAMDEFAALQAKATPGPWEYHMRNRGVVLSGPSGAVVELVNPDPSHDQAHVNTRFLDGDVIAASRSIPAAEAAALIREMREMLRKMHDFWKECDSDCPCCGGYARHISGCELAQMLKD